MEAQQKALEDEYKAIAAARERVAASAFDISVIFNERSETNKRTGEKNSSYSIGNLDKKIQAQKKLIEQVNQLYARNVPEELISELLKEDPEDAVVYARQLLNNPTRLKKLSGQITELKELSDDLGNAAVKSKFDDIGAEAGTVFSDSFKDTLTEKLGGVFDDIFTDEYIAKISANISMAAASVTGTAAVMPSYLSSAADNQQSNHRKTAATTTGEQILKIVDINYNYIARGINETNRRNNIMGGG